MELISVFLITLFLTMAITRLIVFNAPCRTLTDYIRHKTFLYIHHIYFGIILMALAFPFILFKKLNSVSLIIFTIGLSLSLDELSAWIMWSHYPEKKEFLATLAVYLIIAVYYWFVLNLF